MLGDVLWGRLVNEIQWVEGSQRVGRGDAGGSSGLELMGGYWLGMSGMQRLQPLRTAFIAERSGGNSRHSLAHTSWGKITLKD